MNDCPNADVRDLLPDLLHDRLDEATRAMVDSHLEGCADCRAELALLGDLRASLRQTPVLNIAAITAAVPSYRAPVRRSWVGWRTAAAITLVAAGGSSLLVMQRGNTPHRDSASVAGAPLVPAPVQAIAPIESATVAVTTPVRQPMAGAVKTPSATQAPAAQPSAPERGELALGGGTLTDLSDRELASLLKDIESLDVLPSTDVESIPIAPIAPRRGAP